MTEKKRQSTVQPEQTQSFNSSAEDELDLIDLLKFLGRKKVFILAVTFVFTLLSIFYAQSITPVYRATVGLLDPNENSPFPVLEQLGLELTNKISPQTIKPINIFERFLLNIKSHELKQEVFVNGGFQKKFFREAGIDTDQSVFATYIKRDGGTFVVLEGTKQVHLDGGIFLELKGSKPKVMLEFLTALVEAAKENVNTEINDIVRSIAKTRINNLSAKIKDLHQEIAVQKQVEKEKKAIEPLQKQKERANEIVRLSKALDMAKRMGIKNHNFDTTTDNVPLWFRYGELALQEEIKILRSQEETPSNKNLSIDKLKLKRLQQKTISLRSEIPKNRELSMAKAKLKRIKE